MPRLPSANPVHQPVTARRSGGIGQNSMTTYICKWTLAWPLLLVTCCAMSICLPRGLAAAAVGSSSSSSSSIISLHVLDRIRNQLGLAWAPPPNNYNAHHPQPSQQDAMQPQAFEGSPEQIHHLEWGAGGVTSQELPASPGNIGMREGTGKGVEESHQYAVVIDGGSTGSRMFVYRFFYPGRGAKREIECIASKKVTPGLSAFDGRPEEASEYMRPLFEHAAGVIPGVYQSETLVFLQATAGMRLLSEASQESIYDHIYMDLAHPEGEKLPFPFRLYRRNVGTLSGRLEGFYAALSVNYLTGRIDTHLERESVGATEGGDAEDTGGGSLAPTEGEDVGGSIRGSSASRGTRRGPTQTLVGALDLGGSSTQIVFQHMEDTGGALDESDFWVQSYLAYGVDTIRYRLWSFLTRHVAPMDPALVAGTAVENPCAFAGHEEWFKGHRLVGTGQANLCGKEIRRMLWDEEHEKCTPLQPCGLDGIEHPPLTGQFLAMSVFFFALDCMKQLGPSDLPHWPSPSIDEIEKAAARFCAQSWSSLNTTATNHAFTRDDLLPYRCAEVVYIHTLLKHGYGFPGDSRDVTFVLDIEGMEVEWTLGFALSEVPLDQEEAELGTAATPVHHHVYLDEADKEEEQEQAAVEARRRRRVGDGRTGVKSVKMDLPEEQPELRGCEDMEGRGQGVQGEPPRWESGWQSLTFNLSELHRLARAWHPQVGGGLVSGTWSWVEIGACMVSSVGICLAIALVLVYVRGDRDWSLCSPKSTPPASPVGRRTRQGCVKEVWEPHEKDARKAELSPM